MPETLWADAEGTRLAYEVSGSGPVVLFLHAGIADRTMWEPQVAALSDRYRCISLDLRGFGESDIGTIEFSRRDDIGAVLDALSAPSATLVGCSIGAAMAVDFAIERPERVDRLVVIGVTPGGFDGPDPALDALLEEAEAAYEQGDFETAVSLEVKAWVDGPGRAAGTAPQWLRDKVRRWIMPTYEVEGWSLSRLLDPPAMGRLGEIRAPTLVLVGTADADVIRAGCAATAAGIAGGTLVEIADAAHLPNLERPDEFNDALEGFLGA